MCPVALLLCLLDSWHVLLFAWSCNLVKVRDMVTSFRYTSQRQFSKLNIDGLNWYVVCRLIHAHHWLIFIANSLLWMQCSEFSLRNRSRLHKGTKCSTLITPSIDASHTIELFTCYRRNPRVTLKTGSLQISRPKKRYGYDLYRYIHEYKHNNTPFKTYENAESLVTYVDGRKGTTTVISGRRRSTRR